MDVCEPNGYRQRSIINAFVPELLGFIHVSNRVKLPRPTLEHVRS